MASSVLQTFGIRFHEATPSAWGSAERGEAVFRILKRVLRDVANDPSLKDQYLQIKKSGTLNEKVVFILRQLASNVTVLDDGSLDFDSIISSDGQRLSITEFAESAVLHACVVAEHLFEQRVLGVGKEAGRINTKAMRATFVSYSIKNAFDRWVQQVIDTNENINQEFAIDFYKVQKRGVKVQASVNYPLEISDMY